MAQPAFDMSKVSTADKILFGSALLLLIDSFLPWQRACASDVLGTDVGIDLCVSFSAWGGRAAFLGVLMGLGALLLALWIGLRIMMPTMNLPMPASTITTILVAVTFGTGLLKFILAVTDHPGFGAFVGLILLLALGYGGYMKMQEAKATAPPPPPPVA